MYSVYILTVPDGRKYVGTTAMPVKRRWNHGNGYRFCQRIGESKEIPVAQYTSSGMLIAVYPSAKLASVVTGAQAGHISKVCKGQRGSAAGFVWKYV